MPVQKDKLFKSAALKIIAYPYLWAIVIEIPISGAMLLISLAFESKVKDISSDTSMVMPVIVSSVMIFFIYLLIFLISKKQYFKAFNIIDKQKIAEKYFPAFLLSNLFFPNMVSSVFINISDFAVKASVFPDLTNSANGISSLTLFSNLKSLLSLIVSITIQYFILKNLFLYIDSLSDKISRNQIKKKTIKLFTAITVIFSIIYIINICFFTSFSAVLILEIISMLLYISLLFFWCKLFKTPESENNKAFMKVFPYIIIIVQLTILLTIVFLSIV